MKKFLLWFFDVPAAVEKEEVIEKEEITERLTYEDFFKTPPEQIDFDTLPLVEREHKQTPEPLISHAIATEEPPSWRAYKRDNYTVLFPQYSNEYVLFYSKDTEIRIKPSTDKIVERQWVYDNEDTVKARYRFDDESHIDIVDYEGEFSIHVKMNAKFRLTYNGNDADLIEIDKAIDAPITDYTNRLLPVGDIHLKFEGGKCTLGIEDNKTYLLLESSGYTSIKFLGGD